MASAWAMATAKRVAGDGGYNGNGNGDGAKDPAIWATTGERGMMVAMGHGLCVCFGLCGETTKNKKRATS
jgi:hypothetical protein